MGDWSWLWQGILGNWATIIVAAVGGAMMAVLRHVTQKWAAVLLYGLRGFFLVLFILLAIKGLAWFHATEADVVTPENVESKIRQWSENFGFRVGPDQDRMAGGQVYFSLLVTTRTNETVVVRRTKDMSRYILVMDSVILSDEVRTMLASMPRSELDGLVRQMRTELARARIGYNIEIPIADPKRPGGIAVTVRLPITAQLSEDAFIRAVDEVGSALILVVNAANVRLEERDIKAPK
jgi:hypothetical protein